MNSRPQMGRFRQQCEYIVWGSNGPLAVDRGVGVLPGLFQYPNVLPGERWHQTQKPLALMRQVVRLCEPGGAVLDPFAGSGSTMEAALLEGHEAAGIELEQHNVDIIRRRLEGVQVCMAFDAAPQMQTLFDNIDGGKELMNNIWEHLARGLAAVGGFIAGLYGGWSGAMTVLVIFMVADYVLGCTCALTGRSTKTPGGGFLSSVAFVGILKKAVIMLVVLLSVQLDGVIGGKAMFQSAAIFFYIANEGLSILENCALMDVPVPKPLRDALEALKNKGNDAGQSDDGGDENP